ncbi:MAG: leucyl aminopeptidase family protein [Actinomycetes bacterium]
MPLPTVRTTATRDLTGHDADVLAVPLSPSADGPLPGPGTAEAAAAYRLDLASVVEQAGASGSAGAVATVPVTADDGLPSRLLLVGTGDGSPVDLRRAGAALARATRGRERLATPAVAGADADQVAAFTEGLLLAAYSPPRTGVTEGPKPPVGDVVLLGQGRRGEQAVDAAAVAAAATWRVRDLANTPSSTKNPAWVAEQAVAAAAGVDGVAVEVLDERRLAAEGFGGLLAVGGGSASPPRLVTVGWTPKGRRGRHVVLVGKGITYDTGGLSIKPREAMVPMKTDMAGAAVALAAVLAAARRGVRHRVTALLPLAENAVSGSSYRPGDVVRVWGGTTVEVANTDAEGRLVLADAMAWADATLDPDVLVDVATLTGAASLGLGRRHAALYTADDALAAGLEAAAAATGERVWRMPLVEDYRRALDSEVADLRHVPSDPKVGGGSITAALFLREFAGARRWVHLDIAGPARADKDEHEVTKGASGFGARLLLRWLEDLR